MYKGSLVACLGLSIAITSCDMATTKFCKVSELPPCEVYVGEDLPEDHPSVLEAVCRHQND